MFIIQNSVFAEIQFSQKSSTDTKKEPHALPQQVLVQQTPIISCCYYKLPHEFWTMGCAATGARDTKMKAQYQDFQTSYSSFLW